MQTTIDRFRSDIDRFLERTQMAPTAFGRDSVNDASFYFDLAAGRSPGLRTVQKVYEYMASHRRKRARAA